KRTRKRRKARRSGRPYGNDSSLTGRRAALTLQFVLARPLSAFFGPEEVEMAQSEDDAVRHLAAARAGSRADLGQALELGRKYLLLVAERELDADVQAKGGASDLVQETFLEAQRDFAQFRGTTEAELLAWLRQMLLHNIANFTRRYRGTGKRAV